MKHRRFSWIFYAKLLAAAAVLVCAAAGCSSQFATPYDLNNLCFEYDTVSNADGLYVIITKHIASQSDVKIPTTIYDIPVREVAESAFAGDTDITAVTFGENVQSIGANAFGGCTGLQSVEFPVSASDIHIGDYAFTGCTSLESVVIPENVSSVGRGAFYDCTSLQTVTLSNKQLSDIGGRAFAGTPWLRKLSQKKEFVTVGDGVLIAYGGESKDVKLPKSVKTISGAFAGNTTVENVKLTGNVKCIGEMAFMGCDSLETITIPNGLEEIGDSAFYGCTNLKWVILKDKVTTIGQDAFAHCGAAIYVNEGTKAEEYCKTNEIPYCIM